MPVSLKTEPRMLRRIQEKIIARGLKFVLGIPRYIDLELLGLHLKVLGGGS